MRRAMVGVVVGLVVAATMLAAGPAASGQAASGPSEQNTSLTRQLDAVVMPAKFKADMGACAIELPSGRILYEKNADEPLAPASNMKLLTTAVAMETLGARSTLKTRLARKGDTLALIGTGDPGFGDPKIALKQGKEITAAYEEWAKALQASGTAGQIKQLVFDDSIFESQWQHPDWKEKDLGSWFCAPVGGLCINDSCVDVSVEVENGSIEPLLMPACSQFEIVNHAQIGKPNGIMVRRPGESWQLLISGRCSGKTASYSVTVPDPGMFAATALHDILQAGPCPDLAAPKRQKVTGQSGELLEGWELVGTSETALADVLERCNTDSQNLFAESLFKLVGSKATGTEGSWASGRIAVMQFLRKHDLPTENVLLDDGSGLSKQNRVTARLLASLLARMQSQPDWKVWMDSMAVAGDSGTLRKRFHGPMEGKVFAKTGYIAGVSALSGYIDCGEGKWVAFSFLYNKITSTAPAKQAQERACQILYREMQGTTEAEMGKKGDKEKRQEAEAVQAELPKRHRRTGR